MQITDKNGFLIEITDMDKPVEQAAEFAGYEFGDSQNSNNSFHQQRCLYWKDLHTKLLQLQSELNQQ